MDGLDHVTDKPCPEDLDQRPVIHQVRDQSVRTLKSVKVGCAENHFPKEPRPESMPLIVAVRQSELLERDLA